MNPLQPAMMAAAPLAHPLAPPVVYPPTSDFDPDEVFETVLALHPDGTAHKTQASGDVTFLNEKGQTTVVPHEKVVRHLLARREAPAAPAEEPAPKRRRNAPPAE